jgi:hypothetical protein
MERTFPVVTMNIPGRSSFEDWLYVQSGHEYSCKRNYSYKNVLHNDTMSHVIQSRVSGFSVRCYSLPRSHPSTTPYQPRCNVAVMLHYGHTTVLVVYSDSINAIVNHEKNNAAQEYYLQGH